MKVLLVTNMYPNRYNPYYGIFVYEQVKAVTQCFPDINYSIFYIKGNKDKFEYIRSINAVHKEINNGKYDLVHIHYGFSGLFLLNPFKRLKIPVIVTLHGGDIQAEQGKKVQVFFTKKILKHVQYAITLNERMDIIARKYTKNTMIIPCSVDTDLFSPPVKRSIISSSKPYKIIFPSAHSRMVKNYPLFQETLKVMRQKYGIDCVEIELNNMTRKQVHELYCDADAMLMTSISEGSPQVVKEAMACNLPVVSTKVGDVDVLLDGVKDSGCVFPHDANLLADKLYESMQDNIKGICPRDRIFQLGLDNKSVATRIYNLYNIAVCH